MGLCKYDFILIFLILYCLILNVAIKHVKLYMNLSIHNLIILMKIEGKKVKTFWFTMSKYNLSFESYDHRNFDL